MSEDTAERRPALLCIECLGIEVYLHASWLQPLFGLGLMACLVMQRWSVALWLSTSLAMGCLIAMHELGHALAARWLGARRIRVVLVADLWACTALLQGSRAESRLGYALYCAAGWLAQVLVGAICLALLPLQQQPGIADPVTAGVAFAMLPMNVVVLLGSVLPWRGSDGAVLLRHLRGLPPQDPAWRHIDIC